MFIQMELVLVHMSALNIKLPQSYSICVYCVFVSVHTKAVNIGSRSC